MTMVSIAPTILFPQIIYRTKQDLQFNSENEGLCFLASFPATGTLTHIQFATGTVTTTTAVNCRIETWDTASTPTFTPTGTLYHADATGSLTITATTDNSKILEMPINSGTGISVTAGDVVAIRFKMPAGTSDVNLAYLADAGQPFLPWSGAAAVGYDQSGAGTYSMTAGTPPLALKYTTLGIVPIMGYTGPIISTGESSGFTSASSPKEYGNVFTLPYKARVAGAFLHMYWEPTGTVLLNCRAAAGTLLSASPVANGISGYTVGFIPLTTPQTIAKNIKFSLSIEATGTGASYMRHTNVTSNAELAGSHAGINTYQVTYVGTTPTETNTRVNCIVPVIDQVDDGDGAGAGGLAANPIKGFTS